MAKAPGPSTALVLAFTLVLTIFGGISVLPQAEPQAANLTTGCLQVAAWPDNAFDTVNEFPSEVWTKPGSQRNIRTLRVANNCPFDISEIRFYYYIREQRNVTDGRYSAASTTVSGTFNQGDVGDPVYCNSWGTGPTSLCGIVPESRIVSVSQDGRTATIGVGGNPATTTNSGSGGVWVGCGLPSNSLIPPFVFVPAGSEEPEKDHDPCTEDASIRWLPEYSKAQGWTATTRGNGDGTGPSDRLAVRSRATQFLLSGAAPEPFIRELVFKAQTTQAIRHGVASGCGDRQTTAQLNSPSSPGSNRIFASGGAFADKDEGQPIFGTGVPAGTKIVDVVTATEVVVNNPLPSTTVTITIGTPPPCGTSVLYDDNVNFYDIGVQAGMTLTVTPGTPGPQSPQCAATGQTAGRFTITSVTAKSLIFTPPATHVSPCISASITTGTDYTVSPAMQANATLLARGDLADPTRLPRAQDFTIAFNVAGGSDPNTRIPIQVVGFPALYPCMATSANTAACPWAQPTTAFETTCIAPASTLHRCILPNDIPNHPLGCSGAEPTTCGVNEGGQSPSIYVATDGADVAPTIARTYTRDSDGNGHIDRLDAYFNKRIEPTSFDRNRFTIKSRLHQPYASSECPAMETDVPSTPTTAYACDTYRVANAFLTDHPFGMPTRLPGGVDQGYTVATFMLQEQPYYDTGATPFLQYAAPTGCHKDLSKPTCSLRDLAGNQVRSITGNSLVATDASPPVLIGAWGREGFDRLDVFFSETVTADPAYVQTPGTHTCGGPPLNPCITNTTVYDPAGRFLDRCIEPGMDLVFDPSGPSNNPGGAPTYTFAGPYKITDVQQGQITFENPPGTQRPPMTNGAKFHVVTALAGVVTACHLVLFDDRGSTAGIPTPCNAVDTMNDFVREAVMLADRTDTRGLPQSGSHFVFVTKEDLTNNPGRTIKFGPCDVHPLSGDSLGPQLDPVTRVPFIRDAVGLPMVFVNLPYVRSVACVAPAACNSTSQLQDMTVDFNQRGITAGMTLYFAGNPQGYRVVGVSGVGNTTLSFTPVYSSGGTATPPPAGTSYWITGFQNKTWMSGGVEIRPNGFSRHITYPLVIRADMDVSHNVMRVLFNGPVRYPIGGERTNRAVTHGDMDVASATGTGQGPQGFVRTLFARPIVDTVLLETDHDARPEDVDNSPSFFKVHCNKIQGANLEDDTSVGITPGKSSFVPCDDPDRFYGWDEDPTGRVLTPDVAVMDITKPRILSAKTVDSNRNGWVDGVELKFTEPVNDASYCVTIQTEPDFCPDADQQLKGLLRFHDPWSPNQYQRETRSKPMWETSPRGGFRWDTGDTQNDETGILQLVNTTYDERGVPVVRTRDFEADYNAWACTGTGPSCVIDPSKQIADLWTNGVSAYHRHKQQTDFIPHLTLPTAGLFRDMAQQPVPDTPAGRMPVNYVPEYCEMVSPAMFPGFVVSTTNREDVSAPTPFSGKCDIRARPTAPEVYSVAVLDGSPPVVWKAETYDSPYFDRDHCIATERCHTDRARDPLQAISYGNGTIDGYRLTFSEPVNDGSICPGDWHVKGYEPHSGIHNVTGQRYPPTHLDPRWKTRTNDNEVILAFNETVRIKSFSVSGPGRNDRYTAADLDEHGLPIPAILTPEGTRIPGMTYAAEVELLGGRRIPVPDTGSRPELTYAATRCGVADLAPSPNIMLAIDPLGLTESDGAAPVIVNVGGSLGERELVVEFSEPVDDGGRGALVRDDFNYYDVDRAGVAGKSSTEEVCHGDNDYIQVKEAGCQPQLLHQAVIPLETPIQSGDRAQDKLAAVAGLIREIAPTVPKLMRQSVADVKVPIANAKDTVPPGALRDFRVEEALTDAGSVTLTWTAPGGDGLGGAAVAGYNIRVGNGTPLKGFTGPDDFRDVLNPTGVDLQAENFDPMEMAPANHTQTVIVRGLQPNTTYYFMVQAEDLAGNGGPLSNMVTTHTTRDVTPPLCLEKGSTSKVVPCPLQVESADCPRGDNPIQARGCTFKWSGAKDDESPRALVYRWKVSDQELDRVLTTDSATKGTSVTFAFDEIPAITRNGTYYFHLSAFSGGGYTTPAHYKFTIGAGGIPLADLAAVNDCIQDRVTPVRLVSNDTVLNDVRWDFEALDCDLPGSVVGLDIWRKDGNTFQFLKRIDGDLAELARIGHWVDNTQGAGPNSQYRVNLVFDGNPAQTQPDPQTGYKALEDRTPEDVPVWAWLLIGIGLALIVAGIVIYFVLRGKKAEKAGAVPYAWESANPDQIGIDEATGLPVHEVRCPSCNNPFQAIGNLPLPVTCPNCGTTGTLD